MTMLRGWGGGGGWWGGNYVLCFVHTWGSCWALCTLDHAVYCFPLFFFGWFRGKTFWAHSGGFRVCRYRSFGLFWEPFGLPVEIWGLRFQPTDLLFFLASGV